MKSLAPAARRCQPQSQSRLAFAGVALNDCDFSERDIRFPQPVNLKQRNIRHADYTDAFGTAEEELDSGSCFSSALIDSLLKLRLLSLNFETKNTQPFSWVLFADVCAFPLRKRQAFFAHLK